MTGLDVRRVAPDVWTAAADDRRALFAAGPDGVIVVGTFGSQGQARALLDAVVRTVPGKAVSAVIAPIDHLDHSGQTALVAAESELIAHELCAAVIERRGARGQRSADRAVPGAGERLLLAGRDIELLHPGPSQGSGNLAVHVPDAGLLFVVGPRADARYGLWPDVHFKHAAHVWRELAGLDPEVVVPGRGALMDGAGLRRAAAYLDALAEASQRAFADGVPIWEIEAMEPYVGERLRARFGDLEGFDRHVGIGAIRLVHFYLMGGWGPEDTNRPELAFATARG